MVPYHQGECVGEVEEGKRKKPQKEGNIHIPELGHREGPLHSFHYNLFIISSAAGKIAFITPFISSAGSASKTIRSPVTG